MRPPIGGNDAIGVHEFPSQHDIVGRLENLKSKLDVHLLWHARFVAVQFRLFRQMVLKQVLSLGLGVRGIRNESVGRDRQSRPCRGRRRGVDPGDDSAIQIPLRRYFRRSRNPCMSGWPSARCCTGPPGLCGGPPKKDGAPPVPRFPPAGPPGVVPCGGAGGWAAAVADNIAIIPAVANTPLHHCPPFAASSA